MTDESIEIILVEDNAHEAELAIRSLRKNNLANKIVHLDDGEEALQYIFCEGKYEDMQRPARQLILLDLNLPKISGLEILKAIKTHETTQMIPVIVLTSSKEERDVVDSYRLGVNSYIVKPVNFNAFVAAMADLKMYWLLLNQWPVANK